MTDVRIQLHGTLVALVLAVGVGLATVSLDGQSNASNSSNGSGKSARTAWGEPDLQGIWAVG